MRDAIFLFKFGVHVSRKSLKTSRPGVNFINILGAAFASADPEIAKKTDNLTVFLCFRDLYTQNLLFQR
jgi:hypothetical protein